MIRQTLKFNKFAVTICFTVLMMILSTQVWAAERITQIKIKGAARIEPSTIISYMILQVGDEATEQGMNRTLKSLFATGLFADVLLYQEDNALIVSVVENPIINEIAFEGNDELSNDALLSEVQLRPRVVLTRTKVSADVERLLSIYRLTGRFSASIEPKVIKLDQNRINLVFEVNEGPETRIQKISFVGNERFGDSKLENVISSKESRWYRFLTSSDKYDPDRLSFDQELLRRFYLNHGYADFNITSAVAELTPDKKDFFLTLSLDEGPRYTIGDVTLENNVVDLNADLLKSSLTIKKGDWYNASQVENNVANLTNETGNQQYAFIDIRPRVDRQRDTDVINIIFGINEGKKSFIEEVNIKGNVRTLDEVVRREIQVVEGDPYNRTKLRKSEQNIRNLDFFDKVDVKINQGSAPDKTVVDVSVQEKSTGEMSIGAGFSTADGPLADFRIKEKNLLGTGQELEFATTLSGVRTQFDLSFAEPYFLNRDLRMGFDIFHTTRDLQDESSFDRLQTGGGLSIGYPLAEYWRQSLSYKIERQKITDIKADASRFIKDQAGDRTTSAVSQRLVYDARDSALEPTEGLLAKLSTEVAGLGGDAQYVSATLGATYFYPVYDQWILKLEGEGGYIVGWGDDDIKINERFFLGGSSLRGFESAGVGPRDTLTDDALGGNRYARGSVEMGFPSGLPKEFGVRGHLFSDFGVLGSVDASGAEVADEETLRLTVGGGVSWRSPLGPIRVDIATPVIKEDFDVKEIFQFSFGTTF